MKLEQENMYFLLHKIIFMLKYHKNNKNNKNNNNIISFILKNYK